MSDRNSDAAAPATVVRPSPLSPHLQVWRWHVTMAASILTRATGVALYGGLLILAFGALSLAGGPEVYATYLGWVGSWLGRIVLFAITFSIFYHLAAGVRHLFWDFGKGFEPKTADLTAVGCMALGLAAAVAVWLVAVMTGGA